MPDQLGNARCEFQISEKFQIARYPRAAPDNNLVDMTDPNREIINRVLAGELDKYREIVRRFEADVYHIAAPVLGSRSLAEDVTQEVFLTAYRRLDAYHLDQPFRPWLLGITRNVVLNELRRRSRESARMELYSRYVVAMSSESGTSHADQAMAALRRCRDRLTKVAAAAIRGRYDENLDLETLAKQLNRSVTATRQLLYRTRITLRDCIESQLTIDGGGE